jgi:NPCBM/NEW2 domain/Secretion system C-terminal sorting domain/Carbohydrate esterase, sialic acid-specific acetylesterase
MKNISNQWRTMFRLHLLFALLLSSVYSYGQITPIIDQFGSIQINYPLNNSVFQQNNSGQAAITVAGQILRGTYYTNAELNSLQIKIEQYNYSTGTWSDKNTSALSTLPCTGCNNDPSIDPQTFFNNSLVTLDKGWYRVSIGYTYTNCGTFFMPLTVERTFGVGDVYVVSGQSNASGFTRDYDNYLMTYESNSSYKNTSQANISPIVQDNQIAEGSIINRIYTNNRSEVDENNKLRRVKGLPLYSSNSVLGLQKFISGKEYDKNEMGIAPNGFDSWSWCRFSNELVKLKQYPVLIFNASHPNTEIKDWTTNTISAQDNKTNFDFYLKPTLQLYGGAFGVKAVLWQQGENDNSLIVDASKPVYSNSDYSSQLTTLITNSRTSMANLNIPWVIGKTSFTVGKTTGLRTDSRVIKETLSPSALESGIVNRFYADGTQPGNILSQQNSVINNTNIFDGFHADDFKEDYRSNYKRLHFDGYEPSGNGANGNGLMKAGLGWYNAVNNINNITAVSPQKPYKIKVTKTNNQYVLTIVNPNILDINGNEVQITTAMGSIYWLKDNNGISDTPESTGNSYTIPANPSSYYITCYYQANANSPLIPSQPYYVKNCNGCRIGSSASALTRSLTIPASGGNTSSLFDNIHDGVFPKVTNCIPWVYLTFDENANKLVVNANANTTGTGRDGTITITDEITGGTVQTLNIHQDGTAATCQVYLSDLSPTYVSQGFGTLQNNLSVGGNPLKINGTTYSKGLGTHTYDNTSNPTGPVATIKYSLAGGNYTSFQAFAGRDDEALSCGCGSQQQKFIVNIDGVQKFDSGIFTFGSPKTVNIAIPSGSQTLELITLDGNDANYGDHVDWADAKLICNGTTPPPSGIVSGNCYTIQSANNNLAMQAMTDGTVQKANLNASLATQKWKAELAVGSSFKFTSQSNGQVMKVNSSNYGEPVTLGGYSQDNFHIWNMTASGSSYLVALPSGVTWDMQGAGSGTNLQLWGTTLETPPNNYRLWNFTQTTCTNTSSNCTAKYLSDLSPIPTPYQDYGNLTNNLSVSGNPLKINNTTYSKGLGTHAYSTVKYALNGQYARFKSTVGLDDEVSGCTTCGQSLTFIVKADNATIYTSPVLTQYQVGNIDVDVSGKNQLELIVNFNNPNGYNWADHADWASNSFQLTCPTARLGETEVAAAPEKQEFSIFPNPTNDKLTVKFSLENQSEVVFSITDMQGKALENYQYKGEKGNHTFIIEVGQLPQGIYILRGNIENKMNVKKFVIER